MNRLRFFLALLFLSLSAGSARAHIGSPDVFFDGKIGPYPAGITIRMPAVIPGRAEIDVRATSEHPLEVFILPLFSKTAVKNSPPPDAARPVPGEPGLYHGELWLMRSGGYSVEVRVRGDAGEGVVQIPINSEAMHQLPMPRLLATILIALGGLLYVGGREIVRAAASESTLPPGATMDSSHRRRGRIAVRVAAVVCVAMIGFGRYWWNLEEASFQGKLRKGVWPDLTAETHSEGAQRILRLTLGEKSFDPHRAIPLLTDHGKLLHVFLIGERESGGIAHLHPFRQSGKVFETVLPQLPEGDYQVFVDLTLADSGISTTTTTRLHLPPVPSGPAGSSKLQADPDDSWASCPAAAAPSASEPAPAYRFDDGLQIVWKSHPPLRMRRDAGMQFEVRDSAGQPVPLEPYMGMISHAAVMRSDGSVFAHLHPAGNFSMAAQTFFESKVAKEAAGDTFAPVEVDHSKMHHGAAGANSPSSFYLPYEFPSAGNYHVWVQFKIGGQVRTARFEATVLPPQS
ncbi:MAG TPA: hypothetical protein VK961_10020 [Chthoniobacter sp.]|nr:hypothetical protein [Chthoniobacter sp.]